jgi:glycosyltransferase involved in cell wall biosynthesis
MRILILNQYALPAGEAGITRHGEIGAELVKRGHDVTVIASDFDYLTRMPTQRGGESGATSHNGVKFIWAKTGSYVANDRRRVASMVRYGLSATRAGLGRRPGADIVVGSSPHLLAPLAASVVARLRKVPWVFEARDIWPSALVDMRAIARSGTTHRVLARLERYLYANADAVVSVPPQGSLRLEELGIDATKGTHIPNAAWTIATEPVPLPGTLDRVLREADGRFVLVYTGAVGVMQDFDNVLAAITQLKQGHQEHYRRLLVLIVGGGVAARSTVRGAADLALDHLHVHPAVPKPAAQSLLRRADACLLSLAPADVFRYGLSPNKLFDYFAAAKPVLIASAYPTLVDDAKAGIRFMPGDPAALARAIVEMMNTPERERTAMGERGRRLVEMEYSIGPITDRYEALLEELVARKSSKFSVPH